MNVAVIGLGSMGRRRIRLMKEMYPDYNIIGIDKREDRREEASKQLNISCFDSISLVERKVDCVFVCTSPLSHSGIIRDSIMCGCHVFTELNLVSDGYDEIIVLAKEKNVTIFLSSTFLYREELRYIRAKVSGKKQWNYIYHIGQYLPDWHPWENYKDYFAGEDRTNGCREIMAIELPWLTSAFGDIVDATAIGDKMSGLNIDYRDNFMVQLAHENGNKGCLVVDVVSPVAVRKLEVYCEGKYLSWNGTPDSLKEFDYTSKKLQDVQLLEKTEHMEGYDSFIIENAYKNEIKEFFDVLLNGKKPLYGLEQDIKILEIIDRIGA